MTLDDHKRYYPPISAEELAVVLSASNYAVANICTATKINKWSLHKPISYPSIAMLSEADIYKANCGLSIPIEGDHDQDELVGVWEYNRPTGGLTSPYRLSDFNRYHHLAEVPIRVQITMARGILDGDGGIVRYPTITGTVVVNPDADIDVRELGYLTDDVGIYMRITRDGTTEEIGLDDKGALMYPITDTINEAIYMCKLLGKAYKVVLGLIKRNGNTLSLDPDFGDNTTIVTPDYMTAEEYTGLKATIEMSVARGAKNVITMRLAITNSNTYDVKVSIALYGLWYYAYNPNNILLNDNYATVTEMSLPANSTIYWVPPDAEEINDDNYMVIRDESGYNQNTIVYKYKAKVTSSAGYVTSTVIDSNS